MTSLFRASSDSSTPSPHSFGIGVDRPAFRNLACLCAPESADSRSLLLRNDKQRRIWEGAERNKTMGVLKLPENVRKGLVIQQQYDEKAGLATLFSYKGTAMEMVLKSPRFWFLVLLHLTLWLVKKFQCKPPEECGETTAFRDIIMKTYSVQFGGARLVL